MMKRITALLLVLCLLLCGCGAQAEPTQATQEPISLDALIAANGRAPETVESNVTETTAATEATTVPTEPELCFNPLNGEVLEEPFTGRLYASTVSNMQENMPHVNLVKADVVMEMYVNMNNIVRCLALFSDIESVEAIGSTRSTRPIFNDIAQHYSLILSHAGGSDTALNDAADRGVENLNVENWDVMQVATTSYRDTEYNRSLENSLFAIGSGIQAYAQAQGWPMEMSKDYGLRFTENGTPADGEDATHISLTFAYKEAKKDTKMIYDADLGKYVWNQYGQEMTDQISGEKEAFTNVIIMLTQISNEGLYHQADFLAGGEGYYANGGKIVPITWICDGDTEPFRFFTTDGAELELGMGNSYIAIAPTGSPVSWEA